MTKARTNTYCGRKGGATIKGKFYPLPRVSEILCKQIEKQANKLAIRRLRRERKLNA